MARIKSPKPPKASKSAFNYSQDKFETQKQLANYLAKEVKRQVALELKRQEAIRYETPRYLRKAESSLLVHHDVYKVQEQFGEKFSRRLSTANIDVNKIGASSKFLSPQLTPKQDRVLTRIKQGKTVRISEKDLDALVEKLASERERFGKLDAEQAAIEEIGNFLGENTSNKVREEFEKVKSGEWTLNSFVNNNKQIFKHYLISDSEYEEDDNKA